MPDLITLFWRQGRRKGRHIYAQLGPSPSDDDVEVGTMDTAELAAETCEAHNERLAAETARKRMAARGVRGHGMTGVQIGDGGQQFNRF